MSTPPPEPSKEEIIECRNSVLQQLQTDGILNTLDTRDIKRFKMDDGYIRRFLLHHDNVQKLAQKMAIQTLKWRKENDCNDISEKDFDDELLQRGNLYLHGRDIDGFRLLVFCVRNHHKGSSLEDLKAKKFMIYCLERLEREEKNTWITVFFDMQDAGLRNMDMDFIQYMIGMFNNYYPWVLNYIVVLDMSWILNAMWNIIKGWLPPKAIEKIRMVKVKELPPIVPPSEALIRWGGTNPYVYKFEPEISKIPMDLNGDIEAKKVNFVHQNSSVSSTSDLSNKVIGSQSNAVSVEIEPKDELVFPTNEIGSVVSIFITNCGQGRVGFKVKTTSPEKYKVRPSVGTVMPQEKVEVSVTLSEQISVSLLVKDKFLLMVMPTDSKSLSYADFSTVFKSNNKDDILEYKFKVGFCTVIETRLQQSPQIANNDVVLTKLDQLIGRQSSLEDRFQSANRLMFITLLLMVGFLFIMLMYMSSLTSSVVNSTLKKGYADDL